MNKKSETMYHGKKYFNRKLSSGREICPGFGKKGLGHAKHSHAYGWKDYDHAECRYCKKVFGIKEEG